MIPRQQPLYLLVLCVFLSSTHAIILDAVPSPCASACRPVASSLENCQYLTCICDEQHSRDFQSCLTCLYRLFPNNETYVAAQGTLQSFQTNCRDKLAVTLNISSISPSGTQGSTSLPSSSRPANSTSIRSTSSGASGSQTPIPTISSNSTTVVSPSSSSTSISSSSTKTTSSIAPTGPPTKLGTQEPQMCRLRSDYPSRRIARSYEVAEERRPIANTGRVVLAFLAVVVFIPIGVLVVRT